MPNSCVNFFSRCNAADEQIDLMNQQIRTAKLDFWSGVLVGSAVMFTGAAKTSNSNNPGVTFFSYFLGGAAIATAGAILAHQHAKRADEHLRLSVDIYNPSAISPFLPILRARSRTKHVVRWGKAGILRGKTGCRLTDEALQRHNRIPADPK